MVVIGLWGGRPNENWVGVWLGKRELGFGVVGPCRLGLGNRVLSWQTRVVD